MSAVSQFPPAHLIADELSEGDADGREGDGATVIDNRPPLGLPAPEEQQQYQQVGDTSNKDEQTGLAAKFDALGPMVVNSDGTLSRIHNWASMTAAEQTNTARVINARNQTRLKALRNSEAEREAAEGRETATAAGHPSKT